MWLVKSILLAVSLCADCFAVTACSSVTLKNVTVRTIMPIALIFGFVQTAMMVVGWLFGDMFVGYIERAAHIVSFLLLLYVGGSMLLGGIFQKEEAMNLNGLKNVAIGALASSFDALAVGAGLSMSMPRPEELWADFISVFIATVASVFAGMFCGNKVGARLGRIAEIAGGIVLIGIGVGIII